MTFFRDLTQYEYSAEASPGTQNVGWLAFGHEFEKATPEEKLLDLVWDHCAVSVAQTRGLHECEFCPADTSNDAERNGRRLLLGSAEIRVVSRSGQTYAAPNLIYHYILVHEYAPPDGFREALEHGLRPTSPEYFHRLSQLGLPWSTTPLAEKKGSRFRFVKTPEGVKKVYE